MQSLQARREADSVVIGPTYLRDPKSPTPHAYTVRLVLTRQEVHW